MKTAIINTTLFEGAEFLRRDNVDLVFDESAILEVREGAGVERCRVIDGRDFFVTPGFVNAHFHPSQQLNRGLSVGVCHDAQMDLLHATSRIKDAEAKYWLSLVAILEGLKAGTTCFYSVGSDIDTQVRAYRALGVRAACAMIPKDIEASEKPVEVRALSWKGQDRLNLAEDQHRQFHSALVRVHFGVCNVRYASDALIHGMAALAEKYHVGFHMHVAEGDEYVRCAVERTGRRPVEHLRHLGVLGPRMALAHATKLSPAEIGYIAEAGASVVHCPRSNSFVAVGVNVALGSDAAINNNSNEVRGEARAAHANLTNRFERADVVGWRTLFRMLTLNGARALGLGAEIGTIEPGKQADLVLWSKNDMPFIPGYNYLADLIFAESCRAHTVFVGGSKVLEDYRTALVDEAQLIAEARAASERYHAAFENEVKKHFDNGDDQEEL
jgi:5-methylthioadenosine/S-adenosylhomocysteine deaminase